MIPSVTRILSVLNNFSGIPPERLEAAANRGTEVHSQCAAYAMGAFGVDEDNRYVQSYIRWYDSMVVQAHAVEREFSHPRLGYVGHPDLVATIRWHGDCVIDLKTPITQSRAWALQVAAYAELVQSQDGGLLIQNQGALMLDPDGGPPRMVWYPERDEYFALFLSAQNLWRYFGDG